MALLWDLDPATMTLGASGGVETITTAGPVFVASGATEGPTLPVTDGNVALRLNGIASPDTAALTSDAPVALPATGAFVVAMSVSATLLADEYGWLSIFQWYSVSQVEKWEFILTDYPAPSHVLAQARTATASPAFTEAVSTPPDSGRHVWIYTWSPTGTVLFLDGVQVAAGTTPVLGDLSTYTGSMNISNSGSPNVAPVDIFYAAMHSDVVDAVTLTAAVEGRFLPAPHPVTLAWAAPLFDGGLPVSSFVVRIADRGAGFQEVVDAVSPVVFTGTAGAAQVAAVNAVGAGRPVELAY